jgi:hypothetical protein
MVTKRAVVEWIPKEQGGRSQPPTGVGLPPYSTVVRFVDAEEPWPPPVAWSLVIEKDETSSEPYRWIADVHFLADEAPHGSLRQGREFELYEGNKRVARGRILGDTIPAETGARTALPRPPVAAVGQATFGGATAESRASSPGGTSTTTKRPAG